MDKRDANAGLDTAIRIAMDAHAGQVDKAGAPYILHPLRVMLKMETDEERIIAVLHDVAEDSAVTIADLRNKGFSSTITDTLQILTHDKAVVSYDEYIVNIAGNPLAKRIKLADLEDNMDLSRISDPTEKDKQRISKYQRAREKLQQP